VVVLKTGQTGGFPEAKSFFPVILSGKNNIEKQND
jgi:hypothetical protein